MNDCTQTKPETCGLNTGFINRFWEGYGFSRAANARQKYALEPLRVGFLNHKRFLATSTLSAI
jgi:hypothetical protein